MFVSADAQRATCEFCGASIIIDDGSEKVRIKNPGQAGYEFEQGRLKAYDEYMAQAQPMRMELTIEPARKKGSILPWVLGWLFIFPIPVMILIMRAGKLDKSVKMAVIATAWILYLSFVFVCGSR